MTRKEEVFFMQVKSVPFPEMVAPLAHYVQSAAKGLPASFGVAGA